MYSFSITIWFIYNERYIEDTLLVGIKSIDAAYFEHNNEEIYLTKG